MMAQLTGDTAICNQKFTLKKKERKEEKKQFLISSSRSPGHPGQFHQNLLYF